MGQSRFLGDFEQLVLLALLRLKNNAYGVTIRREIEKRTGRSVSVGALYTTIDRLEQKGFVSTRLGDPTPERGGRAKRFVVIEAPGRQALEDSLDAINMMKVGLLDLRPLRGAR